jgi:hypothetical protein
MTDNIEEALANADEIAELTGRDKKDVIADLLDDGKLNNSNAIKENTSAIDRATEMANKTHKLLTALIPILILLSTSGLELTGIIDLTPAGEGDDDEWFWEDEEGNEYDDMIWGCTNDAASNYDPDANVDDGSCEPYEEEECYPEYYDYSLTYADNNTSVVFTYDVDIPCDETQEVEVQFLAYHINNTDGYPDNYSIDIWDVYNADAEYRSMTLGNFNESVYDLYTYLINDDGDIMKELVWSDIEIKGSEENDGEEEEGEE